jgi:carboxylesterase
VPVKVQTFVPVELSTNGRRIIPGAEPFWYRGGKVGCLLVHGFTSTPYDLRALGDYLAARNYTVYAPLIAGHGTHPHDLARTNLADWLESIHAAYYALRRECEKVFCVGISLGATFLVNLAGQIYPSGLVLIGCPFVVRHYSFYRFAYYCFRLCRVRFIRKWYAHSLDPAIRRQRPNYHYLPVTCAPDVARAMKLSLQMLPRLECPVLLLQSTQDHAADSSSIRVFMERTRAIEREVIWVPNRYHVLTIDHGKEETFAQITRFLERHF